MDLERTQEAQPVPDALFEAASIWHARLRQPGTASAERAAFDAWVALDTRNQAAFAEVEQLFGKLEAPVRTVAADPGVGKTPITYLPPRVSRTPRVFSRPAHAIAAGVAAFTIAASVWVGEGAFDRLRSDTFTRVGETRNILLPDGSEIALNTDTAVSFHFRDDRRNVELLRGEAFFSVAPDPRKPFFVRTSTGIVRVVGTRFNVRAERDVIIVNVEEGVVEAIPPENAPGLPLRLTRDQEGTLSADGVTRRDGDAGSATAWRRGKLVFYRTPLARVTAELERYAAGRILVASERLRNQSVTGVFRTTDTREAISIIEETLHVRSVSLPGITILY